MKIKRSQIAAAIAGALALAGAGQLSASVYAGSSLTVEDLAIDLIPTEAFGALPLQDYTFNTRADASLNGTDELDTATCGTINGPACSAVAPVLSSVANAPANTIDRASGDFSFFGPGSGETYSNSASEIGESEILTGDVTTTTQISEVEIQESGQGSASTRVASTTDFLFTFLVTGGTVQLDLDFLANPNIYLSIDTPDAETWAARASVSSSFTLQSTNGTSVSWTPGGFSTGTQGFDFGDCTSGTGLTVVCNERADTQNLNRDLNLPSGTNPFGVGRSDNRDPSDPDLGLTDFGISISGLGVGEYTLSLTATTDAEAQQRVAVPEPGVLALLGAGLLGLGAVTRRRLRG